LPEKGSFMLQALVQASRQLFKTLGRSWGPVADSPPSQRPGPALSSRYADRPIYRPLERLVLTDEVSRTLFEEYEGHRRGPRGEEETGWVLLGHRREKEAVALATLPAGARSEAGIAHVRFNSEAQVVASRMVRRVDRQLGILGVVHTHPGSLRHPSGGDYEGDKQWVRLLRGNEGVFAIGTADAKQGAAGELPMAIQPKPNSQCFLGLRFTWYALGEQDRKYRPLPLTVTIGPDLARPLHDVWAILEAHAERLEQLYRRLAGVQVNVIDGPALEVYVPLDEPEDSLRVVLQNDAVDYYVVRKGQWLASEHREPLVDRGVYLMLAALAARAQADQGPSFGN
jgi:hypothetical protein